MEQFTGRWNQSIGWSAPLPAWDGPGTLVVGFSPADLLDGDAPLPAIAAEFGRSVLIGASTSTASSPSTTGTGTSPATPLPA